MREKRFQNFLLNIYCLCKKFFVNISNVLQQFLKKCFYSNAVIRFVNHPKQ